MAQQNEWLSWAEDKADMVNYVNTLTKQFFDISSSSSGGAKRQARLARGGPSLPSVHIFRGRHSHVDTMERATRVHGHFMGLRLVLGLHVCSYQSHRATRWSCHGHGQNQGGNRMRHPLFHRRFTGKVWCDLHAFSAIFNPFYCRPSPTVFCGTCNSCSETWLWSAPYSWFWLSPERKANP